MPPPPPLAQKTHPSPRSRYNRPPNLPRPASGRVRRYYPCVAVSGDGDGEEGGAGAQWRTHATSDDLEQRGWDVETYEQWMEDVKEGKGEGEGLAALPSSPTATDTWWKPHVASFAPISTSNLPSNTPITSGVSFTTITINVPTHLSSLFSRFTSSGGHFIRTSLPTNAGFAAALAHASKLVPEAPYAFVNATGLGARELVPDTNMYPTRGQTILVRGEASKASTFEGIGTINYVIPRKGSGTSVLGGTKQSGNWDTEPDEETTREILERCKVLAPELLSRDGEFEVLKVQVGLRPSRVGGARVQREVVEGEGRRWRVVHAYGHSGAGYQNSVGVARKVVRLIGEFEGVEKVAAKL
ncbi:hypothetical protein G7Y79_00019g047170 [Physcia stellaris]|nr:hypothetical protein G7Y79_00019g047170 [Physcia stellaris]